MAGMNGFVAIGVSEAGKRILAAGLAFERAERRRLNPPPPRRRELDVVREEMVRHDALVARIQAALDATGDRPRVRLADIIVATAVEFGYQSWVLAGDGRKREHCIPRHVAMLLCHELTGSTFTQIGRALGNRDHTTVISGVRGARQKMERDPDLAAKVGGLRARLKGTA